MTPTNNKLGTFAGVFTPSILTILGIILFLRLGFVVGDAGLGRVLVIILLANAVSVLTSFSLAAIATNFKVKGGGDYYLISRSLGPEFGGAIGIVLFLAQSVSIAFYAIGFGEGVTAAFDTDWWTPTLVAFVAVGALFLLAWLGADWATRFQYGIMVLLCASLATFAWGAVGTWDGARLGANWQPGGTLSFWAAFALFFPAVTGFTQGVSMSGDLRDPAKSLPLGTFLAVGVSMVVYFAAALLFSGAMPNDELSADYGAMGRIATWPWIISGGIFAATLSSALASFLGAPRILQALASDRLFRFLTPFSVVSAEGNPRRAVLLSLAVALGTVALGDLNVIAPLVSMFFLISYGLLNYATYYEARAKSPSFRPRFRWYHERLSLGGCLACGAMILAIDPLAGAIALAVLLGLHQYLARTVGPDRWSDGSRSANFQRVRRSLREMRDTAAHDRDWRPVILAFSDDRLRRERLLRFAAWIEGQSGLTTAVRMIEGEGRSARQERAAAEDDLRADIRTWELGAFARVVAAADPWVAFQVLFQTSGIGPIRPNIALFNWFDREETAEDAPALRSYGRYLRTALRHDCNVVVLAAQKEKLEALYAAEGARRIDVWWLDDGSSKLALLLAYLMRREDAWAGSELRLVTAETGAPADELRARIQATLDDVRIPAAIEIVTGSGWEPMIAATAGASVAFVPFRVREEGLCDAYGRPLPLSLDGLPPLALVLAARDIDLVSHPDEGEQAERALARDSAERATATATARRRDAESARAKRDELVESVTRARLGGPAEAELEALAAELRAAEEELEQAERRAAKAEAKALGAAEELRSDEPERRAPAQESKHEAGREA